MRFICKVRATPELVQLAKDDDRFPLNTHAQPYWLVPARGSRYGFRMLYTPRRDEPQIADIPEMLAEDLITALTT